MEQSMPIWLLPAATFVVGIIVGLIISKMRQSSPNQTQQQLDQLQERFNSYQNEVITHFNTTENLVSKLTQSYQDVQEHISHGAERLALDNAAREKLITKLVDEVPGTEHLAVAPIAEVKPAEEAPKDYAPKGNDEIGALDESYGLKTKK